MPSTVNGFVLKTLNQFDDPHFVRYFIPFVLSFISLEIVVHVGSYHAWMDGRTDAWAGLGWWVGRLLYSAELIVYSSKISLIFRF